MKSCNCFILILISLSGWAHSANYEYVVHIYTAKKLFAGTDAPVFIKLYDNNDKELLGETRLTPNSKDPFEKGDHDVDKIQVENYLGKITAIEIKRGSGNQVNDDWNLDRVVVEDPRNEFLYVFKCYCELGKANQWKRVPGRLDCKKGYSTWNGQCYDVDECKQAGTCKDPKALCTNTQGSYHCKNCKDGYSYDGTKCQDIDECYRGNHSCRHICLNTNGGYVCECRAGYKLYDRFNCKDIDECARRPCDLLGTCMNHPGSFSCICPSGFKSINNKCENINECNGPNPCNWKTSLKCVDYEGGYKCDCKAGYYNEKENSCKDINECFGQNLCNSRSSVCENLDGTYRCNCLPGFIASVDGKQCIPRVCNPLVIPSGAVVNPLRCKKPDSNQYGDVCTISCTAGYKISNSSHSQLTCGQDASWIGTLPSCIPISCKSLSPPQNGRVIPSLCSSGGNYKQRCSFICDDGYRRDGADESSCQADGRWSAKTPSCKKSNSDAWVRCAPGISVDLRPGERTASVINLWKPPQTSPNVKYISSSHNKYDRFPVGISYVTWTVSSDNIHNVSCSFPVSVYDKEKPVAVSCPKNPLAIVTTKEKELVHLKKVGFTDNVAIKYVEYSYKSPVELKIGTYVVTVIAKDTSDNIAYCTYQVIIRAKSCGDLDAPLDGDVRCTSFVDTKYCSVSCRDNKVVFNATGNWGARTWYCLGNDPVWKPTSKVPDCVEYSSYNGSSCPNGKVLIQTTLPTSAAVIVQACGSCPSGMYFQNGQCKECPAGTYQDTTGNYGKRSCKKCEVNTSSKPRSTKKNDCRALCPPGYYSVDGFHPCQLCKRGEYQPNFGSTSCDKCPSGRTCTRHEATISVQSCGPCPMIARIEPTGKVQRLLGSTLELFCYMHPTTASSEKIRWQVNLDDSGQLIGAVYIKKLYDSNKQIGLKLTVRNLKTYHTGNYECVVENQFGEDRKRVHVTVLSTDGGGGSGIGPLNDDK